MVTLAAGLDEVFARRPWKDYQRQFLDFAEAIRSGRKPAVSGEDGLNALAVVLGIYESCREQRQVQLTT